MYRWWSDRYDAIFELKLFKFNITNWEKAQKSIYSHISYDLYNTIALNCSSVTDICISDWFSSIYDLEQIILVGNFLEKSYTKILHDKLCKIAITPAVSQIDYFNQTDCKSMFLHEQRV